MRTKLCLITYFICCFFIVMIPTGAIAEESVFLQNYSIDVLRNDPDGGQSISILKIDREFDDFTSYVDIKITKSDHDYFIRNMGHAYNFTATRNEQGKYCLRKYDDIGETSEIYGIVQGFNENTIMYKNENGDSKKIILKRPFNDVFKITDRPLEIGAYISACIATGPDGACIDTLCGDVRYKHIGYLDKERNSIDGYYYTYYGIKSGGKILFKEFGKGYEYQKIISAFYGKYIALYASSDAYSGNPITDVVFDLDNTPVEQVIIRVDGKPLRLNDVYPYTDSKSGRILLPVRAYADNLGLQTHWDENTNKITIESDKVSAIFKINSQIAVINGKEKQMDCPAVLQDGRTFVPLRFLIETLGGKIDYNKASGEVNITSLPFIVPVNELPEIKYQDPKDLDNSNSVLKIKN